MDELRQCLVETYNLNQERGQLLLSVPNILDSEKHEECMARLDMIRNRLGFLNLKIPVFEEQMGKLRQCLVERYYLTKEKNKLLLTDSNITDPETYIECVARLDIIKNRMRFLESQIPALDDALRAKLNLPTVSTPANEEKGNNTDDSCLLPGISALAITENPDSSINDSIVVSRDSTDDAQTNYTGDRDIWLNVGALAIAYT